MPHRARQAILWESRTAKGQEADMEHADWLDGGFDSAQARFLMVTAITHHRFTSPAWGEHEIRKLYTELAEIELAAAQVLTAQPAASSPGRVRIWRQP